MKKISVIVPCFNEEAVLPQLFARLGAVAVTWDADHEIICVDDGSRDRTWEILKAQHARDSRWRCLCFARNFGHQTAVSAGLHYATGDAGVVIDADLQDPPEVILELLRVWREGADIVYAQRRRRDGETEGSETAERFEQFEPRGGFSPSWFARQCGVKRAGPKARGRRSGFRRIASSVVVTAFAR